MAVSTRETVQPHRADRSADHPGDRDHARVQRAVEAEHIATAVRDCRRAFAERDLASDKASDPVRRPGGAGAAGIAARTCRQVSARRGDGITEHSESARGKQHQSGGWCGLKGFARRCGERSVSEPRTRRGPLCQMNRNRGPCEIDYERGDGTHHEQVRDRVSTAVDCRRRRLHAGVDQVQPHPRATEIDKEPHVGLVNPRQPHGNGCVAVRVGGRHPGRLRIELGTPSRRCGFPRRRAVRRAARFRPLLIDLTKSNYELAFGG